MALDFPKLDCREEHFSIPGPHRDLKLFLRYLPAARSSGARRAVLYIHGATFPSALSIAHRFDGYAWRDALNEAGFDVWGLDFQGYGFSDRYPAMAGPADATAPLGIAAETAGQVEAAVRFILAHQGLPSLSLISHSWGSMPAGCFAARQDGLLDRWVLFGPVARRVAAEPARAPLAWDEVTLEAQWNRFVEDVPSGEPPVLSRRHFDEWGEHYLDSDPASRTRSPPRVRVPSGPSLDIQRAWSGTLAYDPGAVRVPVAIIRGEWDSVFPDEDARWLFDAFTAAPVKRDIKISRATHLMHLERGRLALYREANAFLLGDDIAPET